MQPVNVNTDGLRVAGRSYEDVGQAVYDLYQTLAGSKAVARFYGDDESGQAFAQGYVEPMSALLESFRDLGTSMISTGGSVLDTAYAFDRTNLEASATLNEIANTMTYGDDGSHAGHGGRK